MSEAQQAAGEKAKAPRHVEPVDPEITAMRRVLKIFNGLADPAARSRVINWAASRALECGASKLAHPGPLNA